jgi:serine/threonine protein kinase
MLAVIDFGGATYNWDGHKSRVVNTRQYRSPEVVMQVQIQTSSSGDSRGLSGGHGGSSSSRSRTTSHSRSSRVEPGEGEPVWDCSSDVWSAGCIIAETYSGELLFPTVCIHSYMLVCIYVCMYVCMYVCTCVSMFHIWVNI